MLASLTKMIGLILPFTTALLRKVLFYHLQQHTSQQTAFQLGYLALA